LRRARYLLERGGGNGADAELQSRQDAPPPPHQDAPPPRHQDAPPPPHQHCVTSAWASACWSGASA
jgi:hypothetical protein